MDNDSFHNQYDSNYTDPYDPFTFEDPPVLGVPHLISLVCYGLVFLLGAPGNALVVWVTAFRMPRSVNSLWFMHLALADLLCCLSLPLLMVPLAMDQHWPFGPLACKLLSGALSLTMYCSVLLLVLISLDRWLLVSRPVFCQNWRQPRRAWWACAAAWALALLFSAPHFAYMQQISRGIEKVECVALHSPSLAWASTVLRTLLGFLLPFLAIVVCHWVVYRRAGQGPGAGQKRGGRSQRTLRVICAVVLSFFLCWLPLHVVDFLFLLLSGEYLYQPDLRLAHVLALCLAYLNSCLNPLLYVCLGQSFKDSLRRSLRSMFSFISEEPVRTQSLTNTKSTMSTIQEKAV
ncbi:C5a anaphylatoxin chemotactic receptor 1 [Megalops cyprinoides]|uniref:C5a anaphylatoxin chemotactic receptor 1 n=1 Tax=Megalops cyprinoides TaxID=118141 RepID=UPI00186465BE|nr:C5a anaphylatoxin chemotactic receptor 1 [Megalops cyprinoides]